MSSIATLYDRLDAQTVVVDHHRSLEEALTDQGTQRPARVSITVLSESCAHVV